MYKVLALFSLFFLVCQAVRPGTAAGQNQSDTTDCIWGMGKCCTPKCDGKHIWKDDDGDKTLVYSGCKIVEGEYTLEVKGTQRMVKSSSVQTVLATGWQLPESKYACIETCDITYKHKADQVQVFRAGGDEGKPPVCGFSHLKRDYIW
ncbi:unnamed protein product [Symbiodinium pilosum]|uniref:Uncharacterized protein n=1 Tax=Symbiodinium pilosum TaxID=2952 RepID=A0A812WNX8_SYMPI|nr:unnamed protein product [Symbiodinium pilosum]